MPKFAVNLRAKQRARIVFNNFSRLKIKIACSLYYIDNVAFLSDVFVVNPILLRIAISIVR